MCFSIRGICRCKTGMKNGEERWQTIGMVHGLIALLVAHTYIEFDERGERIEVIRIISARRATKVERRKYEDENG